MAVVCSTCVCVHEPPALFTDVSICWKMPWFGGLILEEQPDGGQEDYYTTKPLSSAKTHLLFIGKDKVDPHWPSMVRAAVCGHKKKW